MRTAITVKQDMLSHFEESIRREWIIANGLGGYASSTILGINTRKYHGLLVGAFHPPSDRRVCLAKLDEEVTVGNDTYPLGTNEFQTGIFPKGYGLLNEVTLSSFPKFTYNVPNVEIQKTIFVPHEKNAVITLYRILNKSGSEVGIRVFPLVNWRNFHSVTGRWKNSDPVQKHESRKAEISSSFPKSTLIVGAVEGHYHVAEKWIERLFFREEAARGESCLDDCYQPGFFEALAKPQSDESFAIVAVADQEGGIAREIMQELPSTLREIGMFYEKEIGRRERLSAEFYKEHKDVVAYDWLSWLISATDSFVVAGSGVGRKSVIAGYHWFGAWGRDTFVSLSGLLLVTGRYEDARKIFAGYARHCSQGLIPNFIPESDEPIAYNAVDATLWYVNAVWQYLKYINDFEFVKEQLWETLKTIIENHAKGTMFNIQVADDGLLRHGSQLTWMDATAEGKPVTPRDGKAVEIQALWYNALKIMELIASRLGENSQAERYRSMASKAKKSFNEKFWNSKKNCLFDVVGENGVDGSLRPNQIIAVALDFTMLDSSRSDGVVATVQRELLTPFGLRTLARDDPRYVGSCIGDRGSRDRAYHNGTVWPWLLGPFTGAFLKAKGNAESGRRSASNYLSSLLSRQMLEAGLGNLSEIFDGETPHVPRGCIAQAWSVAEPFRAYIEDVMQVRPRYERKLLQEL